MLIFAGLCCGDGSMKTAFAHLYSLSFIESAWTEVAHANPRGSAASKACQRVPYVSRFLSFCRSLPGQLGNVNLTSFLPPRSKTLFNLS